MTLLNEHNWADAEGQQRKLERELFLSSPAAQ